MNIAGREFDEEADLPINDRRRAVEVPESNRRDRIGCQGLAFAILFRDEAV